MENSSSKWPNSLGARHIHGGLAGAITLMTGSAFSITEDVDVMRVPRLLTYLTYVDCNHRAAIDPVLKLEISAMRCCYRLNHGESKASSTRFSRT